MVLVDLDQWGGGTSLLIGAHGLVDAVCVCVRGHQRPGWSLILLHNMFQLSLCFDRGAGPAAGDRFQTKLIRPDKRSGSALRRPGGAFSPDWQVTERIIFYTKFNFRHCFTIDCLHLLAKNDITSQNRK